MAPSSPQTGAVMAGRPPAWRSEIRASFLLGWPLIMTNLAQIGLNAINLSMIGHLGAESLAAGALAVSLYQVFMIFCMGLASAAMPMIATRLGRRRHAPREIRRTVRQALWSVALVCLPIWVILWHVETVLVLLGQRPALAARAVEFMHAMQWALLPFLGYIVLRSFVAAMERAFWTLVVAASALVLNAVIAYPLIVGAFGFPGLGLRGAGLAVTLSSTVMFLGMVLVVTRHRAFRRFYLFGRFWRPDWPRFREFWWLGTPMAIIFAFETTIFYAAVIMMGLIGPTSLAAHAVAMQIASTCFMVPLGFGQVATIRVGRANGRGDPETVTRAGWSAFGLGMGFMVFSATLMLVAPRLLIGLFLDVHDAANAEVVVLSAHFLAFAGLFQLADGGQTLSAGMLRGLHDTRVPMVLAAIGYWVIGIPVGALLAFPLHWEGIGVWCGLLIGLSAVAILMTWRWTNRHDLNLVAR